MKLLKLLQILLLVLFFGSKPVSAAHYSSLYTYYVSGESGYRQIQAAADIQHPVYNIYYATVRSLVYYCWDIPQQSYNNVLVVRQYTNMPQRNYFITGELQVWDDGDRRWTYYPDFYLYRWMPNYGYGSSNYTFYMPSPSTYYYYTSQVSHPGYSNTTETLTSVSDVGTYTYASVADYWQWVCYCNCP